MATFAKTFLAMLLAGVLAFSVVACGGGDGGDEDTAQPADTTQPGDTTQPDTAQPDTTPADVPADTACPTGNAAAILGTDKSFTGVLIDFQTRKPLGGATLHILDNASGRETGETVTSTADGVVMAQFKAGVSKVGFKVVMAGQRDTYQLHYKADGQNETLWSVSNGTYVAAPALAGISIDEAKGILAGGLYYTNDAGEEEGVGCAQIRVLSEADPEAFATGNIRYMNDAGLPTTLDKQDGVNPQVPFFIVGNIPETKDECGNDAPVTVTAQMNGTAIGDTYVFSKAGAIFIGNIFTYTADTAPEGVAPVTANPQPAGCGQ